MTDKLILEQIDLQERRITFFKSKLAGLGYDIKRSLECVIKEIEDNVDFLKLIIKHNDR